MEFANLNLFINVARCGGFAAAARLADLDPSLVSRKIAALEQELGFRLFHRTTRIISLTEAGAEFMNRIEPHLTAIDEARLVGRDLTEKPTGLLRVTASATFGHEVLSPLLPAFLEATPDLKLELLLTDRRIDLIEEGVDLAIRLGALPDSEFIAKKIMPVEFRIYVSPDYCDGPNTISHPSALSEIDCLTYSTGRYRGQVMVQSLDQPPFPVSLSGALTISNALSLKRCACLGMGPAFLPNWLVREELASGVLVDLFPDYHFSVSPTDEAAWFVYPSRLYVPLKVRRFIEYMQSAIRASHETRRPDKR